MPNLLEDDRFASMFSNPDFQVDQESEEFKLLNPLISKVDKEKEKKLLKKTLKQQFQQVGEVS